MPHEDGRAERQPPRIIPVPETIAQEYVDGTLTKKFKEAKTLEGGHSVRCFDAEVEIDGYPGARLHINYEGSVRKVFDFQYVTINPVNDFRSLIATMTIEATDPHKLMLPHRLVEDTTEQNRGIGSSLLKQVEEWIKQVARLSQHPVTLSAETNQWLVIRWLCDKNGFAPIEKDRELYEDLVANVHNTDKYYIDTEGKGFGRRPATIFEKMPDGTLSRLPVRLTFQKVFEPA